MIISFSTIIMPMRYECCLVETKKRILPKYEFFNGLLGEEANYLMLQVDKQMSYRNKV